MQTPLEPTAADRERAEKMPVGSRFGKLVTIGPLFVTIDCNRRQSLVVCECDCGGIVAIRATKLRGGEQRTCGRLRHMGEAMRTHGQSKTTLFHKWRSMVRRCRDKYDKSYPRYGGRGVVVCEEWRSFSAFAEWAGQTGYRRGVSLDRIDNDGPYSPENCRWADAITQMNNTRANRWIEAFGEAKTLANWARDARCAVSSRVVLGRLNRGWTAEDAILKPLRGQHAKSN